MSDVQRAVIKVGTQSLIRDGVIHSEILEQLFHQISTLTKQGWECLLVLSGAVGSGKAHTGVLTRKQAYAAVGQLRALDVAFHAAEAEEVELAMLLLSREDIVNRERYRSLQETVEELLRAQMTPIFNENDATSASSRHDFTDNDHLATILAVTMGADILVLLTSVDGLYTANPQEHADASFIPEVHNINKDVIRNGVGTSSLGRGGMSGKLKAARLATAAGILTIIANANTPDILNRLLLQKEHCGTICHPQHDRRKKMTNRDRWVMSAQHSGASVTVDAGARAALMRRKSLLAVGVKSMEGEFEEGTSIEVVDDQEETIALGLASLDSRQLQGLLHQEQKPFGVEVIHADNLILLGV
jgi:glutamate 5-kinase